MPDSAEKQAVSFFIKRGDYAATLAAQHFHDGEYEKAATLYKQAYAYYKKAEQNLPDDADIKNKLNELKEKYQEAKKNITI